MNFAQYQSARETLIAKDRALRIDSKRGEWSPSEIEADQIIRRIRDEEAKSIWAAEHPDIVHPFPGMEFLTGRSLVVKTKIFQLLLKMPKGALLHAHLDATVNARFLLDLAIQHPAFHVKVPHALTTENVKSTLPQFWALHGSQFSDATSLTGSGYEPGTWVPLLKARENFDFGGPKGFDDWVISSLTISPSEAYGTCNTIAKIWKKFLSTFFVSNGLIRYEPVYERFVEEFIMTSIEDGISYVEPRVNFIYKTMVGSDGQDNLVHRDWLLIIDRVVNQVKSELSKQGRESDFAGFKIIYTTVRIISNEELLWFLEDCLALKKEFPHLICGFDLVGEETEGKPLIYYAETLLRFQERLKAEGVDLPYIFHAGETVGDGTAADSNIYDAILLGTKRIGHGYSLIKHPELIKICREKDIALEVCPISNEILRLTSSMPAHPLPAILNHGVPVALCSDDPGAFGSMGLTFDYFQVIVSSELSGLVTLADLARDSLKHSMLEPEEKEKAINTWKDQWNKYLEYIIHEDALLAGR